MDPWCCAAELLLAGLCLGKRRYLRLGGVASGGPPGGHLPVRPLLGVPVGERSYSKCIAVQPHYTHSRPVRHHRQSPSHLPVHALCKCGRCDLLAPDWPSYSTFINIYIVTGRLVDRSSIAADSLPLTPES